MKRVKVEISFLVEVPDDVDPVDVRVIRNNETGRFIVRDISTHKDIEGSKIIDSSSTTSYAVSR